MSIKAYLFGGAAALAALSLAAGPAAAGAFYIQEQSVKGLGRAYSGEGADVGAASLWWNPASIAGITGRGEVYGGLQSVFVTGDVLDRGSTVTRPGQPATGVGGVNREVDPVLRGLVPNMAAAYRLNDRIVLGLAVTAPFNFTSKYADNSFARYDSIKSRLLTLDIQPTVAYRVTNWLDVGVGFDAEYTDATLTNALPNISPLLPDGRQALTGDGWDYGYTVGAQVHPNAQWNLGLSYRSAIDHELDGTVGVTALQGTPFAQSLNTPGVAKFSTPWMATISGRWQATPKLALNAQVQRIGWSEFKSIAVTTAGGAAVTPENYQDTTTAAVGAEYAIHPKLTLRAGVQYDPTPTVDSTRSTRVPDGDRWLFGTGATFNANDHLKLDLAAAYIHFADTRINATTAAFTGTPLVTPSTVSGVVEGKGAVFSGGVRYAF